MAKAKRYVRPSISKKLCTVCRHKEKHRVELGLARQTPLRKLTALFGLSKDALYRHRRNHMPAELRASLQFDVPDCPISLERLRKSESESLLQNIVAFRGRLIAIAEQAEENGHVDAAIRAYRVLADLNQQEARLLGELAVHTRHVTQNLVIMPEFARLRSEIIRALERHPEARADVARILAAVEADPVDVDFAPAQLEVPKA